MSWAIDPRVCRVFTGIRSVLDVDRAEDEVTLLAQEELDRALTWASDCRYLKNRTLNHLRQQASGNS
jgi:hypothetical protein